MKRRTFVMVAATASVSAGCLGSGPSEGEDRTADDPTDTPGSTDGEARLLDSEFEVTDVECGTATSEHDVETGDEQVTISGTLDGSSGCSSAELVRGEYDAGADALFVEVEAVERDDAGTCTQCIVEIDYVATFEFENGEPGTVTVEHRGATSASASGGGSASGSDDTAAPTDDGY
jgi:hypothetical protein